MLLFPNIIPGLAYPSRIASAAPPFPPDPPGNLVLSPNFGLELWQATKATLLPGTALAPNGEMEGATIIEDDTDGSHHVANMYPGIAVATGAKQCSVYARRDTGIRDLQAVLYDQDFSGYAIYHMDLGNGSAQLNAVVGSLFTNDGVTSSSAPNGYFKLDMAFTTTSAVTAMYIIFLPAKEGGGSYVGDGESSINLWRARLEELS